MRDKKTVNPADVSKGLNITKKLVNTAIVSAVASSDLSLMKEGQSKLITMTLLNNNIADCRIPFGTPLGSAGEVDFYPTAQANLTSGGLPRWDTILADLVDNQGANATFLQALNKRLLRHALYVAQVEVITPDNALGQSQRAENITRMVIPLNSVTDSCVRAGAFVPQYTEYTGTLMFGEEGVVISDFHGFFYKLLAGSQVSMNFYLQAIDTPVFKNV